MGRGVELGVLAGALGVGPAVLLVGGEAGVGKSRLVGEACVRVEGGGLRVLRGWCHPLREPLPFGPVIDALRDGRPQLGSGVVLSAEAGVLLPYLPWLAEWLPAGAGAAGGSGAAGGPDGRDNGQGTGRAGFDSGVVRRGVLEVLEGLGDVVLVVEDVHWADEATRELLLVVARNPPRGLRLVLTYRGEDLPGEGNVLGAPYRRPVGVGGAEIVLGPLDEAGVRELAVSAIGSAAAGGLGRRLFERSGGIPLVAEEDLLVLARRMKGASVTAGAGTGAETGAGAVLGVLEGVEVPRVLRESVGGRVAGLDAVGVAVVEAAAVLEVSASEELLGVLAGLGEEEAEAGLEAALGASVLREPSPGRYGFRHALACRAVYDAISPPRRRRLHRRAVEALEARDPAPLVQIAHHTRRLGDVGAWIPRAVAAVEQAEAVGDDGVAVDLRQQLLDEPALPAQERTRAALALSRIAARRVDPWASVAVLRRIVADPALPTATRGEIRLNLGRILRNQGANSEGRTEMEKAVNELEETRPDLAAVALAAFGSGDQPGTTVAQDRAWMDRAVRLVAASDDPVARATVLAGRISLLAAVGDPLARDLIGRLPRSSTDRDILRQCTLALHNAAHGAYMRADDRQAWTLQDEGKELARHTGYQILEAACDVIRLRLDFVQGRWEGLEERIEEFAPEAGEDSALEAEPLLVRTLLDIACGRWTRARRQLTVFADHDYLGYLEFLLPGIAVAGRLNLLEGDPRAAWETVGPAVEALRGKGNWSYAVDLLPMAVQAALGCGLQEEARQLTEEAATGIEGLEAPGAVAEVAWCRGLIAADADPDRAVEHLEDAQARYEAIGRVHHAAQVTERIGRLLIDTRPDTRDGARHLQKAMDTYTRLDATADAARCRQTLRGAGRERPEPRAPRSPGQQLSPREQQVADLLVTGATNQDIATALAISPRTAEHHVARVLKKLHTTRDRVKDTL
ncbi:AAA family ATPase [Kitasatospora herbaricolor]|uniref:AAA family ATPase n=1 Tax=Kitasatospora herbaricolor TaxID=68217 RepID=UPI0036D78C0A